MSKPDPIADELQAVLNAFLKKHPNVAGIVAAGVTTDGGKHIMASAAQVPVYNTLIFDNQAVQECLCEAIAWNRVVARDMRQRHAGPKQTAPSSRARN